jgi:hypothetical protein
MNNGMPYAVMCPEGDGHCWIFDGYLSDNRMGAERWLKWHLSDKREACSRELKDHYVLLVLDPFEMRGL